MCGSFPSDPKILRLLIFWRSEEGEKSWRREGQMKKDGGKEDEGKEDEGRRRVEEERKEGTITREEKEARRG
jgi:hypothetical protein